MLRELSLYTKSDLRIIPLNSNVFNSPPNLSASLTLVVERNILEPIVVKPYRAILYTRLAPRACSRSKPPRGESRAAGQMDYALVLAIFRLSFQGTRLSSAPYIYSTHIDTYTIHGRCIYRYDGMNVGIARARINQGIVDYRDAAWLARWLMTDDLCESLTFTSRC